jgi:hypothetical protein
MVTLETNNLKELLKNMNKTPEYALLNFLMWNILLVMIPILLHNNSPEVLLLVGINSGSEH